MTRWASGYLLAAVLLGAGGAVGRAQAVTLLATESATASLYSFDTANPSDLILRGQYILNVPSSESFIGGLAFDSGGTLFGLSSGANARLYSLDPSNAATTNIGALGVGFIFEGGLAFDPISGTLYGVNQGFVNNPNLVRINTSTGAGAIVGQIAGGSHDFAGLTFNDAGQLYGLDRVTNALWLIDKNNPGGAGTMQVGTGLGSSGVTIGDAGGMTLDAVGTVYGYADGSRALFTVDLSLGTATVIHSYGLSNLRFFSLAAVSAVPEPSTALLFSLGVLGLATVRRRERYDWRRMLRVISR